MRRSYLTMRPSQLKVEPQKQNKIDVLEFGASRVEISMSMSLHIPGSMELHDRFIMVDQR